MIKIDKVGKIKQIVDENKLSAIIVKTGNENVYIPEKNEFIVTKEFLKNQEEVFKECAYLCEIIMDEFDFSEITTMFKWFHSCVKLEKIIFPKVVNCHNLSDMSRCFVSTKIKSLDLSNWKFSENARVQIENLVAFNVHIKSLKLTKMNILQAHSLAYDCQNIKEIDFGNSCFTIQDNDSLFDIFFNCHKLELVDCSKMTNTGADIVKILHNQIYPQNDDLIILIPN